MTEAAEKLKTQLDNLSEDDREALANYLISTLPDGAEEDDDWEAELMRREAAVESGEAQEIPAEDVFHGLRKNSQ
jgi:putative addiction module component (TIGR02574 family)